MVCILLSGELNLPCLPFSRVIQAGIRILTSTLAPHFSLMTYSSYFPCFRSQLLSRRHLRLHSYIQLHRRNPASLSSCLLLDLPSCPVLHRRQSPPPEHEFGRVKSLRLGFVRLPIMAVEFAACVLMPSDAVLRPKHEKPELFGVGISLGDGVRQILSR
jgi:hypothetical protein